VTGDSLLDPSGDTVDEILVSLASRAYERLYYDSTAARWQH
jgi:hypothetical protein